MVKEYLISLGYSYDKAESILNSYALKKFKRRYIAYTYKRKL